MNSFYRSFFNAASSIAGMIFGLYISIKNFPSISIIYGCLIGAFLFNRIMYYFATFTINKYYDELENPDLDISVSLIIYSGISLMFGSFILHGIQKDFGILAIYEEHKRTLLIILGIIFIFNRIKIKY